ncbi:hypothetical protein JCM11251_007924 [Rhodosporidiobolus azoricus]
MASSPFHTPDDPFLDEHDQLPYTQVCGPPAASAPPPCRPSSASSFNQKQPRWSFLDSAEPDLTLLMCSDEGAVGGGGMQRGLFMPEKKDEYGGMSWSYAAETVQNELDRDSDEEGGTGQSSASGRSGDEDGMKDVSPWTTPEVSQGEFLSTPSHTRANLAVPTQKDDLGASRSSGFLSVPDPTANGLNRSNGSSPDSFVDPYMAASTAPTLPFTPPPPPVYGSTPSPPRFDLHGRRLPSASPSTDPFASALTHRQEHPLPAHPASPGRSPKMRALGSLRSFTAPFGRGHHGVQGEAEDLTTSSFASVGTSREASSTDYWDNSLSLNVSDVRSPAPRPLMSTPTRPPPSTSSNMGRSLREFPLSVPSSPERAAPAFYPTYSSSSPSLRAHTVVDLPSLPLTASTSAPSALSSPHHAVVPISKSSPPQVSQRASALALRRSVTRPPPAALVLVEPPSSLSPPPQSANTSTTATSGSSPSSSAKSALRTINRSPDGFYRPYPAPASPSSTSLLPPPSPLSARRPTSLYGALPLSSPSRLSASPELAFPLPPPSTIGGDTGSPSTAYNPANPFDGHQRAGTSGSGYTAASMETDPARGGRSRPKPSFVSVFVPPAAEGRSLFHESDERDEEGGEIPIYPPRAFKQQGHRAGVDSLSSAVALGLVDSPRRRTAGAGGGRAKLVKPQVEDGRKQEEEKKRRTEAWLNGVVVAGSSSSNNGEGNASTAPSSGLERSANARMRRAAAAAASAVGWSIREEREKSKDDGNDGEKLRGEGKQHEKKGTGVSGWWNRRSSRVRWAILAVGVSLLILLVGLAIGLSRRPADASLAAGDCTCLNGGRASLSSDGKGCHCECRDGWGGTGCSLNATCVDVGGGTGRGRNWVAQGILEVAEKASELWQPEVDIIRLGYVLSTYVFPNSTTMISVSSSGSTAPSCSSHLSLLTLPSLPIGLYPARLDWTTAALLHTLSLTESNSSLTSFRTFASGLSFSPYGDLAATKANSNYQAIVGGYMWDLSVMERVAMDAGWEKTVSPPQEAFERINAAGEGVRNAMEKITANAVAASRQRTKALQHYWVDTLELEADDLDVFRTKVQQAEILLLFDATSGVVSLPPAIACTTGLSSNVAARVNEVEQAAFGLAAVEAGQTGNATCVDRPIHGLLNVLNLRLPFPSADSRSSSLPQQVVVLSSTSYSTSRISIHAGEILSAGPFAAPPSLSPPKTIERFGLLSNLDHVLLDYLLLFPSTSLAKALAAYVVSSSTSPPTPTSDLFTSSSNLADIPQLEVQLWGGLKQRDVAFVRSGLSTGNGTLFFGSSAGSSFRSWALSDSPSLTRIEWTPDAESAQIVNDTSPLGRDSAFEAAWTAAKNGTKANTVWQQLQRAELIG